MEQHLHKISNMTCVLRELNVIDASNNIDVDAMKKDTDNYKVSCPTLSPCFSRETFRAKEYVNQIYICHYLDAK